MEQAAGITSAEQVYRNFYVGAEGVGSASGIVNAKDPLKMVDDMIRNVRMAWEDRQKGRKAMKVFSGKHLR